MNNLIKLGPLVAINQEDVSAVYPSEHSCLTVVLKNGTLIELEKWQLSHSIEETFSILLGSKKIGATVPSRVGDMLGTMRLPSNFTMEKVPEDWKSNTNPKIGIVGNENIVLEPLFSAPIDFVLRGDTPIANFKLDLLNLLKIGRFEDAQIDNAVRLSNFEKLISSDYEIAYFAEENCTKLFCPHLNINIIKRNKADESLMVGFLKRAIVTISEFKE